MLCISSIIYYECRYSLKTQRNIYILLKKSMYEKINVERQHTHLNYLTQVMIGLMRLH